MRAYRYCEAVTTAAGFGWWIFPPTDLQVLWDGHDIFWQCTGWQDWLPLTPSAQFPEMTARFDEAAPESLQGCSPPFLTALPEAGTLQIWTGLMARTRADWSLLIRAPANLPLPGGYHLYEGIIETDRWFGPMFTNMRLTRTNMPIRLRPDFPLALAQPVPRKAYVDATLSSMECVADIAEISEADWTDYQSTIAVPNSDVDRAFGAYAASTRKRNRADCPALQT